MVVLSFYAFTLHPMMSIISSVHVCNVSLLFNIIPYNGKLSRRQVFADLSLIHEDKFSRFLIFAVANIHENKKMSLSCKILA